jgi:polyisoprenoid-binding protein YceI
MKLKLKILLSGLILLAGIMTYLGSCKHDDTALPSGALNLDRGDASVGFKDGKSYFDKVHSNVNWSSPYLGEVSILTGRFNSFGFYKFNFEENNPDSIYFSAWVDLRTVNTSEPYRDGGCLQTNYFNSKVGDPAFIDTIATITSKKVVYSTTDRGYIVTADLYFHGVTKEVTCHLDLSGVLPDHEFSGNIYDVYGFTLKFSFLSQTDFGIEAGETADQVDVVCSANINHPKN